MGSILGPHNASVLYRQVRVIDFSHYQGNKRLTYGEFSWRDSMPVLSEAETETAAGGGSRYSVACWICCCNKPYLYISNAHHATTVVHVLFEVHLHILKDEREGAWGVDDVVQSNYVGVLEVLQERDFSDGSTRSTLLMFQSYLLQSYQLPSDATEWSEWRERGGWSSHVSY